MDKLFTYPGQVIIGNCIEILKNSGMINNADYVFLDPPYDDLQLAWNVLCCLNITKAVTCFMYPDDIGNQMQGFDQVCVWIKPISTKNTTKQYSRFVEAICVWHNKNYFNQELHWSTRTGVFTDTLIEKQIHPHQKPFSLVEKLVLLHTPPGGTVLDPFCGSQVVKRVCDKHGFKSLSIDIKDWLKSERLYHDKQT